LPDELCKLRNELSPRGPVLHSLSIANDTLGHTGSSIVSVGENIAAPEISIAEALAFDRSSASCAACH
jgi:hypothetical protein